MGAHVRHVIGNHGNRFATMVDILSGTFWDNSLFLPQWIFKDHPILLISHSITIDYTVFWPFLHDILVVKLLQTAVCTWRYKLFHRIKIFEYKVTLVPVRLADGHCARNCFIPYAYLTEMCSRFLCILA